MEKLTFRPTFFSQERIILFGALVIATAIAIVALSAQISELGPAGAAEAESMTRTMFLVFSALWVVPVAALWWTIKTNSIEIDHRFLYYKSRPILGHEKNGIIHLENVDHIGHIGKRVIVPAGRSVTAIMVYSLVFRMKDGRKEIVPLAGWDKQTLREIIFYLKGKFPHITIDTHVYRDPSEKITRLFE